MIYTREEILHYLEAERQRFQSAMKYSGPITLWAPNLNKDATESLGCHLVMEGKILPQLSPITEVKRFRSKDILVNKYHKLEVKATSTKTGDITPSESNFEAFAWIWFAFQNFLYRDNYIIPVHIITNPKQCVRPDRYVETLRQSKLSIINAIKEATKTGNYSYYECDLKQMKLRPQKIEQFL